MFETLLWSCFAGRDRLEGEGLSVVVRSEESESTLALSLDKPGFRDAMGFSDPLCDGVMLGLVPSREHQEGRVYCLFVEMKGKNVEHAVLQLENAIRLFRGQLEQKLAGSAFGRTRFSAVVVSDRASPTALPAEVTRRFAKELKSRVHIVSAQRRGPPVDLSDFLWRRPVSSPFAPPAPQAVTPPP